jgi:hypothetical protein
MPLAPVFTPVRAGLPVSRAKGLVGGKHTQKPLFAKHPFEFIKNIVTTERFIAPNLVELYVLNQRVIFRSRKGKG